MSAHRHDASPIRAPLTAAAVLALACAAGLTTAGEPDPTDAHAFSDHHDLLAGPDLAEMPPPPGLGLMGFDGAMERPEVPIAELAIDSLDLDDATLDRVATVLQERASAIDAFVLENTALLEKLRAARQSTDREQLRELMREAFTDLRPELEKGSLEDRIAAVLPAESAEQYHQTIKAHRDAVRATQDAKRAPRDTDAAAKGPRPERGMRERPEGAPRPRDGRAEGRGAGRPDMRGELREIIFIEIPRSHERIKGQREANMTDLIETLDLDATTADRVRSAIRQAAEEAGGPENVDRREVMRSIASELSPEQRQKLREVMRNRRGS
ncbi:MAG: hypothetical protein CMJ31_12560 [Phycisphaerae bacterium]|nr:hypothetical protein [Phycisphaerae bacterium]